MSNRARYLRGPQCVVEVPVESATVIEIGDFVLISSNYAIQASDLADAGDAAANREACADIFAGIAQTASASGETAPVQVDISPLAIYKLSQKTAAAINVGDQVEIYANADNCEDQTVVEGSTSPVATCVKEKGATGTDVECVLALSKIFHTVQS